MEPHSAGTSDLSRRGGNSLGGDTTAEEARPGASPKVIACMTACELTQMACLQGPNGVPPERRTIKEINAFRAC
jgi:hypothetical protein